MHNLAWLTPSFFRHYCQIMMMQQKKRQRRALHHMPVPNSLAGPFHNPSFESLSSWLLLIILFFCVVILVYKFIVILSRIVLVLLLQLCTVLTKCKDLGHFHCYSYLPKWGHNDQDFGQPRNKHLHNIIYIEIVHMKVAQKSCNVWWFCYVFMAV